MTSLSSKVFRFAIKHIASRNFSLKVSPQVQRARLEKASLPFWTSFKFTRQTVDVGGIASEWIDAENADENRVLLYLHGGAYTFGSSKTYADLASRLSHSCAMKVLVINYRLAPEYPFPAALDDATYAYRWLLDQGYRAENLVICGDSAGGGLTLSTLINLRELGVALPAAGVCLSPWTDLSCDGDSMRTHEEIDPFLSAEWLREMATLYVQLEDPKNPLISPLHGDLKGLPPLLVQVGSDEVLLDDSLRLEQRALSDEVDLTLRVYQDMWHVWQIFAAIMPEAKEALLEIAEFVNAKLNDAEPVKQQDSVELVD
ncbi:MAG: alpha/beta hydrolase [Gammaproteobacteria bacterium]|nr:MAG: alpha/beta hydrolase [Gammaproteobacteria bacterium]